MIDGERLLSTRAEDSVMDNGFVLSELVEEKPLAINAGSSKTMDSFAEASDIVERLIRKNKRKARNNFIVAGAFAIAAGILYTQTDSQPDYTVPELELATDDSLSNEQSRINIEECVNVPSIVDGVQHSSTYDACLQLMGSTSPTSLGTEAENILVTIYESGTDNEYSSTDIYNSFDNASGYADTSQLEFAFTVLTNQGKLHGEQFAPYIYVEGRGWSPMEIFERQLIIQMSEAAELESMSESNESDQQPAELEINCNGGVGTEKYGPPTPNPEYNQPPSPVMECDPLLNPVINSYGGVGTEKYGPPAPTNSED